MQVAPSQISPQQPYDIFYFLRNHLDSTTYYVQAKVYDVRTGELLSTIALDQASTNSRLFIKTVQAPPDPVGYGRNIVAISTVYTDSGYTTKSENYEETEQYFLIRSAPIALGGGGVDYRVIRDLVEEELDKAIAKLPKPEKVVIPPFPDMPFDALFGAIGALQREINRVPKEATDLTRVWEAIDHLGVVISMIPPPEKQKPTDLSPITKSVAELEKKLVGEVAMIRAVLPQLTGETRQLVEGKLKDLEEALSKTPLQFIMAKPEPPTPAPKEPADIRSLFS